MQNLPLTLNTPFYGQTSQQRPSYANTIGVTITAQTLAHVYQFSTWITGWDRFQQALSGLISVPAAVGQTYQSASGDLIIRSAPEELLLINAQAGSDLAQQLREGLSAELGHSLDLSHARCRLSVQGEKAVATLQKLFAVDFRLAQFPVGEARMTGSHHVPTLLYRQAEDRLDLYVLTTFARDQLALVMDAGLEFGVACELG